MIRYILVNYRTVQVSDGSSFESTLRLCIDAEHTPGKKFSQAPVDRIMRLETDGRELILNEFADVVDGVAGIVCQVVPGALQPALTRVSSSKQLTKTTISEVFEIAEQKAGDKKDFIQGILYFYVRHNHLIFVTVKGFPRSSVAPFFEWLLQKMQGKSVTVHARLDPAIVGSNLGRVSNFRLRGRSGNGPGVALNVEGEVKRRKGAKTVAWSKAEEVVRALLPHDVFDRLVASLNDRNHLVADVQWSVAGPRSKEVKDAITDVVTELANIDDGVLTVSGNKGSLEEGKVVLEQTRAFEISTDNGVVIDFDHATDVLVRTMHAWVENKQLII